MKLRTLVVQSIIFASAFFFAYRLLIKHLDSRVSELIVKVVDSTNLQLQSSAIASHSSKILKEQPKLATDLAVLTSTSPVSLPPITIGKLKAAIVILCRNSDLDQIISSINGLQASFNGRFKYPYVLMNNEKFTQEFIDRVNAVVVSKATYAVVDQSMWSWPSHVDQVRATECMRVMESKGINYGGSLSYRHMCRFYSGFFFRHEALKDYDWYWRLEPGVEFYCEVDEDPFVYMEKNGKSYGFNIAINEIGGVIDTLHKTAMEWVVKKEVKASLMPYLLNEKGEYNGCHFWSNFEIGRLDLWRSERYIDFFQHLDASGGFFYERWGDAPVHALYIGLTLSKDQVHFFKNIGYLHFPYRHCDDQKELKNKCKCPSDNMWQKVDKEFCLLRWLDYQEKEWSYKDIHAAE